VYALVVGISYKTAPVEVRERFAFGTEDLPRALPRLGREFGGAAILSTCNRTEVYVTASQALTDARPVLRVLAELKGACGPRIDASYMYNGSEAARHLFRVAAGVESMVLGEAEILGQVRTAFAAAMAAGTSDPLLSRLFRSAIRVGRRARSQTNISRHAVSVSSTAVSLARRTLGDLASRTVLVVSAGEAGKLTARNLAERGASRILVTSRTFDRAVQLAADLGGTAVPFEGLGEALARSDIIITSTGAPSFLIGPELMGEVVAQRDARPLLLIDIAVPRDVDPAVRELPHVHLYDIDDLRAVSEENLEARQREVEKVEALVEEEMVRFSEWWRSRGVIPTVAALRERAEQIRREEVARTLRRLPDLSEEERRRVEAMASAIVKKLLHAPIVYLKSSGDAERHTSALRELFDLDRPATEE